MGTAESKDLSLRAMAQFALPPGYFSKFIESVVPQNQNNNAAIIKNNFSSNNGKGIF